MTNPESQRVVVTGLGVITSLGLDRGSFWRNLQSGHKGFSPIESFDTTRYQRKIGAEIKDFQVGNFFPGDRRVAAMGRAKQFALAAAKECLECAGIDAGSGDFRVGVALGTTNGEAMVQQQFIDTFLEGEMASVPSELPGNYPPFTVPQALAEYFHLYGPNMMLPNACAAGNFAIGYAYNCIRTGRADGMIAGGVDAFSRGAFAGFTRVGAISSGVPRPFSLHREGLISGEGAGMLYLESLEQAKRRNADIFAEVVGYGHSCDAWHITQPSASGIAQAVKTALANSKLKPEEISYISVHGTGTEANDPTEAKALKESLGEALDGIPLSSIKSMIGHSMGAASAIECVASILSIRNQFLLPTMNFLEKDPACDVDCVPNQGRSARIRYALKTSSAFGGNNAALIFGEP